MTFNGKLRRFGSEGGRYASWVILLVGVFIMTSLSLKPMILGAVIIAITGFIITAYDGFQVNTEKRMCRDTVNFWGLHTGSWRKLPALEKISVVPTSEAVRAQDNFGNAVSSSKRIYVVRLHPLNSKKIILAGNFRSKEKAMQEGAKLASALEVPVAYAGN